jgi:predicted Zn-dependent protease with MMP-like domain
MWMEYEDFADLVGDALDGLPDQIRGWLDNVEVVVEDWPSRGQLHRLGLGPGGMLLGLYEGVP